MEVPSSRMQRDERTNRLFSSCKITSLSARSKQYTFKSVHVLPILKPKHPLCWGSCLLGSVNAHCVPLERPSRLYLLQICFFYLPTLSHGLTMQIYPRPKGCKLGIQKSKRFFKWLDICGPLCISRFCLRGPCRWTPWKLVLCPCRIHRTWACCMAPSVLQNAALSV